MRKRIFVSRKLEVKFYYCGDAAATLSPLSSFVRCLPNVLCLLSEDSLKSLSGFEITLVDCNKIFSKCNSERKQIFISSSLLEFLWLSIYSNHGLSELAATGDNIESRRDIILPPDIEGAIKRAKDVAKGILRPWPARNLPMPDVNYVLERYQRCDVASEITLFSVAFVILHELAHFLFHEAGVVEQNMIHEIRADEFAISSYLDANCLMSDNVVSYFKKKSLAIIEVCSMFVFLDQIVKRNCRSHPSGIKRLNMLMGKIEDTYDMLFCNESEKEDRNEVLGSITIHAAYNLYFYSQNIFEEHCKEIQQMRDSIICQDYENPEDLLATIKKLYIDADCRRMHYVKLE